MAKSRKQILQELLELENEKVEDLGNVEEPVKSDNVKNDILPEKSDSIIPVEKVKKPRTQKQLEAFERAKAIRDANALKRKEEAQRLALELKKKEEEKIVKKAIALKKKELKKHKVLDEISDDDTPQIKPQSRAILEETKPLPLEKKSVPKIDTPTPTPSVSEATIGKALKPSIKISFY